MILKVMCVITVIALENERGTAFKHTLLFLKTATNTKNSNFRK